MMIIDNHPSITSGLGSAWRRIFAVLIAWFCHLFSALDSRSSSLLRNSLLLVGGTWAGSLPLGIVLAWVLVRTDLPGAGRTVVVRPDALRSPLSPSCRMAGGIGLQGWYTAVWKSPPLLDGWRGVLWIHGVTALPWIVLIVGVGLRRMEPELEEQALLDASSWRVFLKVTLRGAWERCSLPLCGWRSSWRAK